MKKKIKLKELIKNNLETEKNKFYSSQKPIFKIYKFNLQNNVLFSSILNNTKGNFGFYFYLLSNKTNSYFIISTYDSKNTAFNYVKDNLEKLNIGGQEIFITNLLIGHGTNGIFYNVDWWNNNKRIQSLYINDGNYDLKWSTFRIDREKYKGFNFWN